MRDPRGCDAAHKATWQGCASPHGPQVAPCGADAWQGPRESTRTPGWHHEAGGAGRWRAHGLVGPGYRIEAVTQ